MRNNIEDYNSKIVSIVQSHKRTFNTDIEQMLNNLESNRMECLIHLENAFKQLQYTNENMNGYKDIDNIKSRLYVLIDQLGDRYSKINDYNVQMNDIIEDCDTVFKSNLGARYIKVEREITILDCQTVSMAIDRFKTEQRELHTKSNSLIHQVDHLNNQNILMSKNINSIRDEGGMTSSLGRNISNYQNKTQGD